MSRLDELIQELCPNGVPFVRISECCTLEKGRIPIQKAVSGQYPLVVTTAERKTCNTYQFDKPTVCIPLVSSRGHGVASLNELFYQEGKFALGNILCGVTPKDENRLSAKFLHAYLNHKKDFLLVTQMKGGANVSLSVDAIGKVKVPIPPLPVQKEVIRILDVFSEHANLLTAELTARKKQYEHYTYQLLNFDDTIKTFELRYLIDFRNGKGHEKAIVGDGKYIVVNSKFISTNGEVKKYSNKQICPLYIDDILMVMSDLPNGRALAKCFLVTEDDKYTLNQRIGAFHVKDESVIITRFLLYALNRNQQLLRYDNGVDQTNLRKDDILDIMIPVPSIEEQKRIVAILDRFDTLCNDISTGLPAEIAARQKQYEYYRDMLLTFKEASV